MTDTLHAVPLGDLIEHDTSAAEADCVCGPRTTAVPRDDGSTGWLITHRSLDGREKSEQGSTP